MKLAKKLIVSDYFILLLIIIYLAVVAPISPIILSPFNFSEIFSNLGPLFILAAGQMLVLITSGIDLSQISVVSLSSILIGLLLTTQLVDISVAENYLIWGVFLNEEGGILNSGNGQMILAIFIVLLLCSLLGLINGISVAYLKMPPFIVTLVTQMFFGALAIYLTLSDSISYLNENFYNLAEYEVFSTGDFTFTGSSLIGVIIGLTVMYLLRFTALGTSLFAVGSNIQSAKISGIKTERVIVFAYIMSSLFAAIAGILYSSRLEIGRPSMGNFSMLMDIIGANVIAGVSLFGGRGKIMWILFGSMFFVILVNSLNIIGVEFYINDVIKGTLIALAAALDIYRFKYLSEN